MPHRAVPPAAAVDAEPVTEPRSVPEASPVARTPPVRRRSSTRGRERDPLLASIIRSKVEASPVRDQTLSRERLLGWLADHADDRLKLIIAEAGYGKTTLLADFARRDVVRCLWYKLESSDGDWVTFINYFIAACREVVPGFAPSTASLLRDMAVMNPSRDIVLGSLISELGALGEAPTMLILDDFHVVDESTDVAEMLGRLLERAPTSLTFLISSRRRPDLQLGRLAAKGELAQLTTDDLRFSPAETEELFASTYGHPLEPDLLRQVDARTEGWGASLQLLYSSIRSRPPAEVRSFIRVMSGAKGSLYDFLAEEVVGHLDPDMQRFVTRTALLQRVDPRYAAAILGASDAAGSAEVVRLLIEAEDLGLLGRSSLTSVSRRFHPLLRDFLLGRLDEQTTSDERAEMHRRVAHVAETDDWLTACHHYIQAGDHKDAMRTLADAASEALGSGSWGAATEMLPSIKNVEIPPAVMALEARAMALQDPGSALAYLQPVSLDVLSPTSRALVIQTRIYALSRFADIDTLFRSLDELLSDEECPPPFRLIGEAHQAVLRTSDGTGSIPNALRMTAQLGKRQGEENHHYYAGISYHNALVCAIAAGEYQTALECGNLALDHFAATGLPRYEEQSTRACMYTACMEMGLAGQAEEHRVAAARGAGDGDADAYAEVASTLASAGQVEQARSLLDEADRRRAQGRVDTAGLGTLCFARASLYLASGRPDLAYDTLMSLNAEASGEVAGAVIRLSRAAVAAISGGQREGQTLAKDALELARRQGAWRFVPRMEVALAVATLDRASLRSWIATAAQSGNLALLDLADVIGRGLDLLTEVPSEVKASIKRFPDRWLPILRRAVADPNRAIARQAAGLLVEFGTTVDVPRLVAFDRAHRKQPRPHRFANVLLRRISPRLLVHDLGRVEFEVDRRIVSLSDSRRKAASLLIYLVTRPQHTATREQVIDDLWPDADPDAGANSLNQTLYFLRRDIDPWYDDATSPSYVTYESEIVWLDSHMVSADSASFLRAATEAMANAATTDDRLKAFRRYAGQFAPEFQYDEWAIGWRDRVHATFLGLASFLAAELVELKRPREAAAVCQRAMDADPSALDIERSLVCIYLTMGARSAASAQYQHYAAAYLDDYGQAPAPLATLCLNQRHPR